MFDDGIGFREVGGYLDGICLSKLEKYLLRKGWSVENTLDPAQSIVMTLAMGPEPGQCVSYPAYVYHHEGRDRRVDLVRAVDELARTEGRPPEEVAAAIRNEWDVVPEGFDCILCGQCCSRMRDAYQGRVSAEEVEYWERMGLTKILRLVSREQRRGYVIYRAWVNPKTGEYFRKCPWLRKLPGEKKYVCGIHEHKPLKCRSFPYAQDHAEWNGCRAFEHLAEAEQGRGMEEPVVALGMPGRAEIEKQ